MGIKIIANNEQEAEIMSKVARMRGESVDGTQVWSGPIPDGSYVDLSPYMRMSTPEFMFLRKANELDFDEALELGLELCGLYATHITRPDLPEDGTCEFLQRNRTSKAEIHDYLMQVADTCEGKRALQVLSYVIDGSMMPVSTEKYIDVVTSYFKV